MATRGRACVAPRRAGGGRESPVGVSAELSRTSGAAECGPAVLLETHFKTGPVSVCLKGTFLLFLDICFKFIYGNQIKMVSAYIYYNIDTDFIVLKFLLFMVVTSYY